MNQNDFGELVAALRKEIFDPIAGKVWSQARLAEETGLSEKVVGDIERGSRSTLDRDLILRLAGAFSLNTMERDEFFTLSRKVDLAMIPVSDDANVYSDCINLLNSLQCPASLQDSYYNLIAVNRAWCRFYEIPFDFWQKPTDTARFNFIRLMLDPESNMKRILGAKHRKSVELALGLFRWMSLPYRHTEYFADLFSCLMMFPEFGRAWMTAQFIQQDLRSSIKAVTGYHPLVGEVSYTVAKSKILTKDGPLYYSPIMPCSSKTASLFAELALNGGDRVIPLSPFPATEDCVEENQLNRDMAKLFSAPSQSPSYR